MGVFRMFSNRPDSEKGKDDEQSERLKEVLSNNLGEVNEDVCFKMLEHARELFVYWAGQRLATVRYFAAFYSVLAVAYGNILIGCDMSAIETTKAVLMGIGWLGLVATMVFWALDCRNAELVRIAEQAMEVLETGFTKILPFDSIRMMYKEKRPKHPFSQYRCVMHGVVFLCLFVSLLGIFFIPASNFCS